MAFCIRILYNFIQILIRIILIPPFRLKVEGMERIPGNGGAIIAANHISALDPVLVVGVLKRNIHFMAKKELFAYPIFGYLMRKLGMIPVDRKGVDRTAMKTAIKYVQNGDLVGIFPEGTRNKARVRTKAHGGVALLSLKTGAPVIPMGIIGTATPIRKYGFFPWFNRVVLRVGEAIYPPELRDGEIDRPTLDSYTERIMDVVYSLAEDDREPAPGEQS